MSAIRDVANSATNQHKSAMAYEALERLRQEALRQGWFGKIILELEIADGTIMQIHEKTDRVRR